LGWRCRDVTMVRGQCLTHGLRPARAHDHRTLHVRDFLRGGRTVYAGGSVDNTLPIRCRFGKGKISG